MLILIEADIISRLHHNMEISRDVFLDSSNKRRDTIIDRK